MTKTMHLKPPEKCPVCDANVPPHALACLECGADHHSGWKKDSNIYDGTSLPDDDFDYDEFIEKEFGSDIKPSGIKSIWWMTAIILLIALAVLLFFS